MTKNDMQGDHPSEAKADATGLTPADLATVFADVRTARLALRRPHPGDSPAMFAVHGDPLTNQHNPAGPDPNPETSAGTLRDWLRRWEIDGYGYWAVARVGTEGIIGFGGVERQTLRSGRAEPILPAHVRRLAPGVRHRIDTDGRGARAGLSAPPAGDRPHAAPQHCLAADRRAGRAAAPRRGYRADRVRARVDTHQRTSGTGAMDTLSAQDVGARIML